MVLQTPAGASTDADPEQQTDDADVMHEILVSDEGDGALASVRRPRVPEPMTFDLVRPLGARRGELEMNVLAQQGLAAGHIEWAPEIEYAFRDGFAAEFELPFAGSHLEEYKFALQGTLGLLAGGQAIHGWQTIGRLGRGEVADSLDVLYLFGAELARDWSTLQMAGVRREGLAGGRSLGIINSSVFHDLSPHWTLGLEINLEIDGARGARTRVMPQVHHDFDQHLILQIGAGPSWLEGGSGAEPLLTGRLIHAF